MQAPITSLAAALGIMALFGTAAAVAQDASLEMDLAGHIDPRCEFTQFASTAVDFSVRDDASIEFDLYCNLAMTITVESRNGALLHEALASRVGRSAEHERVYDATLSLAAGDFSWQTDSVQMLGGVSFSTGDAVVFDTRGSLAISLREPIAGVESHAGDYADTVGITLSPSVAAFN